MDGTIFALVIIMSTGHRMESGSTYKDARDCAVAAEAQSAADPRTRGVCEPRAGVAFTAPGGGNVIENRQPTVDMARCKKEFEGAAYGGYVSNSCRGL